MKQMELLGIRIELQGNVPVAILREMEGSRALPIYIGGPEARAIAEALEGHVPARPMTHDLLRDVLGETGFRVVRVDITELQRHTFFAEIELAGDESVHRISSRPSDAIALAVRCGSPIFADDDVLDEAGIPDFQDVADERDDENDIELVDEFKRFIEEVAPEDFAN
ncbi:MAG TPA: bifunctional nuclease family protein [Acidimicrobiales bacterium]